MKWHISILSVVLISLTLIPVVHAKDASVHGNRTLMVRQSDNFKDLMDLPQDIKTNLTH